MKQNKNLHPYAVLEEHANRVLISEGKVAFNSANHVARGNQEALKWLDSHKGLYQGPAPNGKKPPKKIIFPATDASGFVLCPLELKSVQGQSLKEVCDFHPFHSD